MLDWPVAGTKPLCDIDIDPVICSQLSPGCLI